MFNGLFNSYFTSPAETSTTGSFDFAGMSEKGIQALQDAINNFANKVEGQISAFNIDATLTGTYAGSDVQAAVQAYLAQAKQTLQDWTNTLRTEATRAQTAYDSWKSGESGQVSGNISSNSSALRSIAGDISLD